MAAKSAAKGPDCEDRVPTCTWVLVTPGAPVLERAAVSGALAQADSERVRNNTPATPRFRPLLRATNPSIAPACSRHRRYQRDPFELGLLRSPQARHCPLRCRAAQRSHQEFLRRGGHQLAGLREYAALNGGAS